MKYIFAKCAAGVCVVLGMLTPSIAGATGWQTYSPVECTTVNGGAFLSGSAQAGNASTSVVTLLCPVHDESDHSVQIGCASGYATATINGWANANGLGTLQLCRVFAAGGGGACGTAKSVTTTNSVVSFGQASTAGSAPNRWCDSSATDGFFLAVTLSGKDSGGSEATLFSYNVTP